jgi:hypothetical protein
MGARTTKGTVFNVAAVSYVHHMWLIVATDRRPQQNESNRNPSLVSRLSTSTNHVPHLS